MNKGISVIFTIFILFLLFIFTSAMLFVFHLWEKTSFKIISLKKAYTYAKKGIEKGIWEIDNDDTKYDCLKDNWRKIFDGDEVDLNEDGINDSKWFYIKDKNGEIIGRYAVLIEDESGKININASGNLSCKFNEGYSCGEIGILSDLIGERKILNIVKFRYGEDNLPGKEKYDDNKNRVDYENDGIDNNADGIFDEKNEGIDDREEFNPEKPYGDDRPFFDISDIKLVGNIGDKTYGKIKNYITVFSYDMERNRDDKERININTANFQELFTLFKNIGYKENVACQIALNIIDYRDKDSVPTVKKINKSIFIGIEDVPYLNEIESVKPWKIETISSGVVIFSEQGGQFIELFNPYDETIDIGGWKIKGVITLFSNVWDNIFSNSKDVYDDAVNGETKISQPDFLGNLIPTTITIKQGAKILPHSFYTIGDLISIVIIIPPKGPPVILFLPVRDPGNCQQYEPILAVNPGSFGVISKILSSIPFLSKIGLDFTVSLYDEKGNLIEKSDYPVDTPYTTVQKNDPRMRGVLNWFPADPTPNSLNSVFIPYTGGEFNQNDWIDNWGSSFYVKNNKFCSPAEISFIHKNSQWRTINLWRNVNDRKIIDNIKTKEEEKIYGKININTADTKVLTCLPLIDRITAGLIVKSRPFKDISEILGRPSGVNLMRNLLSRDITKYGFNSIDDDRDGYIDTEREKEMVFSKIANLITVRSNVFKVIAIGEKVQDKNNNGKIEKEEVIAVKKINIWYDRRKKKIIHRKEI